MTPNRPKIVRDVVIEQPHMEKRQGHKFVIFHLDDHLYALEIEAVKKVVLAVEITPLPEAPEVVIGLINEGGNIIPVFDTRKRFHLPGRELCLTDQLIIARAGKYTVALLVDKVTDVIEPRHEEIAEADAIMPGIGYVDGIVRLKDGMILIHNLAEFLSLDEEKLLDRAIKKHDVKGMPGFDQTPKEGE